MDEQTTIERAAEPRPAPFVQAPPQTIPGILRRLGPGLIIAGSIVGSGELIATTKTGAEAGFWLLWLIIIGCVIKVFTQIEFGRYSIVTGNSTMVGLNEVPGPRLRVNWLLWFWLCMFIATIAQLGGIVGGVGQSLAISLPLTGDFNSKLEVLEAPANYDRQVNLRLKAAAATVAAGSAEEDQLRQEIESELGPRPLIPPNLPFTWDDVYWATFVTLITSVLLVIGRYGVVQSVATFLVASFTAMTIFCLFAQQQSEWAVHWNDLVQGFSFRLPPALENARPVATALATFGIIGVGANELISYPYWCIEKGYAGFTGPRDSSPAWADRARGWMRVMKWDAWCSMVVYTFATIAFYLLGAGVLHRMGLNPSGNEMIRTLAKMYQPTFGDLAPQIFLFGAFTVLYSTFFVAIAGHARVASDAMGLFGVIGRGSDARRMWVKIFCALFPFCSLGIYFLNKEDPVTLVLLGGLSQALMLPMLGFAALYFRYRRCDPRIAPSRLWDVFLWLSFLGLLVTGTWTAYGKLFGP